VERASRIIFALKAFSGADEHGEMLSIHLQQTMDAVLESYQNQMLQGSRIIRQYDEIPPLWCIRQDMEQVWFHLIHNALQAMGYQGTLALGLSRIGDCAVATVSDTGCGIPEANRDKIFDAFFTTRSSGENFGLGLAIVKKIIEKHQGRIEFQSEVGVGTTFSVHLPYSRVLNSEVGVGTTFSVHLPKTSSTS
jgi:signal transduction histidine kinase